MQDMKLEELRHFMVMGTILSLKELQWCGLDLLRSSEELVDRTFLYGI
jgi:hypothetical protein